MENQVNTNAIPYAQMEKKKAANLTIQHTASKNRENKQMVANNVKFKIIGSVKLSKAIHSDIRASRNVKTDL